MASERRILRKQGGVALLEERIYLGEPAITIHVIFSVTGGRDGSSTSFDTLGAAEKYFRVEIARCRSTSH
jgi:hypothetical protein